MKKIIFITFFIFFIFSSIVIAYDLNNIEDEFVKNGEITTYVVVADKGSSSDVLAQINVINYLSRFSDQPAIDIHKLVSEIDGIYERDIITIGNPCINAITKEIMDYKGDCDFEEGLIKFYNRNDKTQLVIYGATDSSTIKITKSLTNKEYSGEEKKFVLSTEELEVKISQEALEKITIDVEEQNKKTLEESGFCGDGIMQLGEDCSNCSGDVRCSSKAYCNNGVCILKETSDYTAVYLFLIITAFGGVSFFAYLILKRRIKKKGINEIKDLAKEVRKTGEDEIVTNYDEIESYIENALSKGYSKQQIKQKLLKSGWKEDDIDLVFRHVNQR